MTTYKQLEKEFERKVKELQANCSHKKTEWLKQYWAIGHPTGYKIKVCKSCNKTLEKKSI